MSKRTLIYLALAMSLNLVFGIASVTATVLRIGPYGSRWRDVLAFVLPVLSAAVSFVLILATSAWRNRSLLVRSIGVIVGTVLLVVMFWVLNSIFAWLGISLANNTILHRLQREQPAFHVP